MSQNEITPPEELSHLGGGGAGYRQVGRRWAWMMTEPPWGIKEGDRVLDAGCGIGRIAVPLAAVMGESISYEGFDIAPEGIAWCQRAITPQHPTFRFRVADIYNKSYNPGGAVRAGEYRFPYEDDSFDFAFLASVFTHLLPEDVENYVAQLGRVLKAGGRTVISYFLLNEWSLAQIEAGNIQKGPGFPHDRGSYRVQNERLPEAAVAHDEDFVRSLYERHGFEVIEPVRYGAWSGRDEAFRQDIIWATRR